MNEVIERPIGTTTVMVEFPFLIIDTLEKFENILATHIGREVIEIQIGVSPESFQPYIDLIILKKENDLWTLSNTYIRVPMSVVSGLKEKYIINNRIIQRLP